jgi:hypothetical protein
MWQQNIQHVSSYVSENIGTSTEIYVVSLVLELLLGRRRGSCHAKELKRTTLALRIMARKKGGKDALL